MAVKNHALRKTNGFSLKGTTHMTSASKAAKHIVAAYKAVRLVDTVTQAKLTALLDSQAFFRIFDTGDEHPYYALASNGQSVVTVFEELVAGLQDWQIGGSSIVQELDKLKERKIANGNDTDDDLDALRLIDCSTITEGQAASKLVNVYFAATVVWSNSDVSVINSKLSNVYGKRYISKNKEQPEMKIARECGAAVRELRKMSKVLRELGNGNSTIRDELEKIQIERGLSGMGANSVITFLLK